VTIGLSPQKQNADDDEYGQELQSDAPPHQLLRQVWAAATHHVYEARDKHQKDGKNRHGHKYIAQLMHGGFFSAKSNACHKLCLRAQ
jgi:hypothetical protein